MSTQSVVLNNTTGGSNKTYHVSIVPKDDGFLVNTAHGKIGSTLRQGTKTQNPVPIEKAQSIFEKLVNKKLKDNYVRQGGEATSFTEQSEVKHSGITLELSTEVGDEEIEALITDPNYVAQRKWDGERRAVMTESGQSQGINKKGQFVPLQTTIANELGQVDSIILDSEIVGETLVAFDILKLGSQCLKNSTYHSRLNMLETLLFNADMPSIKLVETAYTEKEKRALFEQMKADGREGLVFKRLDKPYVEGRSTDTKKYKFWKMASVIVLAHNDARSVQMGLIDDKCEQVFCGNVTIPANKEIPAIGTVVEARYLYAYEESGKLFQPTYLKERTTVEVDECLVSQLFYKQSEL